MDELIRRYLALRKIRNSAASNNNLVQVAAHNKELTSLYLELCKYDYKLVNNRINSILPKN